MVRRILCLVCFFAFIVCFAPSVVAVEAAESDGTPVESTVESTAVQATDGDTTDSVADIDSSSRAAVVPRGQLSSGYYIVCDSPLGDGLRYYVDADYRDCLALNSAGVLINASQSTVYLYCPNYPDVSISAGRWSSFQIRESGYNTRDFVTSNYQDSNIVLDSVSPALPSTSIILCVLLVVCLLGFLVLFLRVR